MTYLTEAPRAETLAPTRWFANLAAEISLSRKRLRAFRQTQTELSAMSDAELADIGICRGMINDVARQAAAMA